jgi:hypothetical protein
VLNNDILINWPVGYNETGEELLKSVDTKMDTFISLLS